MGKAKTKPKMIEQPRPHLEMRPAVIDNPYFSADHPEGRSNPKRITGLRNVKESPAAYLYSKGALDDAQLAAADQFRKLFEALGGSGARAMDWRREFVDGGRFPDPIGAHQIDAGKKMAIAYETLTKAHGLYSWRLVGYVCGEGKHITELTETRRQRDTMTDLLRMYLDCLGEHWGKATKRRVS